MKEVSRHLEILKNAVRQPTKSLTIVEMDVNYAPDLIKILKIEIKKRPHDVLQISPATDSAYLLQEKARKITEAWPDDIGVLFIAGKDGPSEPDQVEFWRELNMQREFWGALSCHVIFLLRPPEFLSILNHAAHLADWIPLKLHLLRSVVHSFPEIFPMQEGPVLSGPPGRPDIARGQFYELDSRLGEAIKHGENPAVLIRRYHLPMLEAALTVHDFHGAIESRKRVREKDLLKSDLPEWFRLNFILDYYLGHLTDADQWALEMLAWAKDHGDVKSEALSYFRRGLTAHEKNAFFRNGELFRGSRRIINKLGPDDELMNAFDEMGFLSLDEKNGKRDTRIEKNLTRAKKFFGQSLALFEKFPQSSELAFACYKSGAMALEEKNLKKATEMMLKALSIFKNMGNDKGEVFATHLSGVIAHKKGDFTFAKKCYSDSLKIAHGHENAHGMAMSYQGLGCIAREEKNFFKAEEFFSKALNIFEESGCSHETAIAYHQLGILARERGRLEKSTGFLIRSLEITTQSIKNGNTVGAEARRPWEAFVDLMHTYIDAPDVLRSRLKENLLKILKKTRAVVE